jgi:hypothetical protein
VKDRIALFVERAPSLPEEDDVHLAAKRNVAQSFHLLEGAGRVDIAQDQRGLLHRDSPHQERQGHVHHDKAPRPQSSC